MAPKPTRILFVLHSSNLNGGAFTGLHQLLKHLPRERFQAYIVVPTKPQPHHEILLAPVVEEIAIARMGGWWTKSNRPLLRRILSEISLNARTLVHTLPQLQLIRLINEWNIDIIYTNGAMVADGALAALSTSRPHLWHVKERIGIKGNTHFYLPDRLLISVFDALSSQLVLMTHFIAEPFDYYGKMKKVQVIYDGIDVTEFQENGSGEVLRQNLHVGDDELLVGMIASLGAEWKRHHRFIEMSAMLKDQVPNVKFVHFGAVPALNSSRRDYYFSLCKLIEELDLTSRFIWGGVVEDIPQMMSALDVLVHPCDTEPFGRVAIEAMAARRPVVGPASGGISESVRDGKTGFLVNPGDPRAFAQATLRLLINPQLKNEMGEAGRAHVIANFSVNKHVAKMIDVIEHLLAR